MLTQNVKTINISMENVDISTFLHFALQQRFATSSIYVAGKFPNNCKTKMFEAPQIICLLDKTLLQHHENMPI